MFMFIHFTDYSLDQSILVVPHLSCNINFLKSIVSVIGFLSGIFVFCRI